MLLMLLLVPPLDRGGEGAVEPVRAPGSKSRPGRNHCHILWHKIGKDGNTACILLEAFASCNALAFEIGQSVLCCDVCCRNVQERAPKLYYVARQRDVAVSQALTHSWRCLLLRAVGTEHQRQGCPGPVGSQGSQGRVNQPGRHQMQEHDVLQLASGMAPGSQQQTDVLLLFLFLLLLLQWVCLLCCC